MAVTCARCGTQNPDGNQFCQACGTPLAVAAPQAVVSPPVPPAPGAPLPGTLPGPPPPPGAYQSPYYAPSAVGPQPPVHRTPWILIISAVVVLVVLMAGCGTAIALFGNRTSNQGSNSLLPSPSPAVTPNPKATPSPTPITAGAGTVSNKAVTLALPPGWTVDQKDDATIVLVDPNGDGSVTVGSGPSSPAQTAQQNKETIDKYFQGKYPDTKNCPGTKTTTGTLNGPTGIFWVLCFTLSSGGQSIQAEAPLYAGANSDGSVYYLVFLATSQSNAKAFITEATPILQSIRWSLT